LKIRSPRFLRRATSKRSEHGASAMDFVPAERESLLRDRAREAVASAERAGAEEAEAFIEEGRATDITIEGSKIARASFGSDGGIGLRVRRGDRIGFAYCESLDEVPRATERALRAAALLNEPAFSFAPPAAHVPAVEGTLDPALVALGVEEGMDAADLLLETVLSQDAGLEVPQGSLAWGCDAFALANSGGFLGSSAGTFLSAGVSALLGGGEPAASVGFASALSRSSSIDPVALAAEAADLALRGRGPQRAAAGRTTVVLHPHAFGEMLEHLIVAPLAGDSFRAGRSPWSGRLGKDVLPAGWSLRDDGGVAGGPLAAPFDDDGILARRVSLVEDGRLAATLESMATAAKAAHRGNGSHGPGDGTAYGASGPRPGSALRSDSMDDGRSCRAPPRPTGRNLILAAPRPASDLLDGIASGLMVYDTMGVHTANAATGDFSVSSTTVFRIRRGEIAGPAKPVMLAGNLPDLLRGAEGMGSDGQWVGGAFSPACVWLGSIRLPGLRVTA
jgi:PmbA protein